MQITLGQRIRKQRVCHYKGLEVLQHSDGKWSIHFGSYVQLCHSEVALEWAASMLMMRVTKSPVSFIVHQRPLPKQAAVNI